jgi:mRNA-degrading endonuclease YafQ of YafQ-DinJ toxin-antitoxin module
MIKLIFTDYFLKKVKLLTKKNSTLKKKIIDKLEVLANNPFEPNLRTHKAGSIKYDKELYSSSITGDIRVLWEFTQDTIEIIEVLDLGSHSGKNKVYK